MRDESVDCCVLIASSTPHFTWICISYHPFGPKISQLTDFKAPLPTPLPWCTLPCQILWRLVHPVASADQETANLTSLLNNWASADSPPSLNIGYKKAIIR